MGAQIMINTESKAPDDHTSANPSSDISVEKPCIQVDGRVATLKDYLVRDLPNCWKLNIDSYLQRVFTYATPWDILALAAGILAAIGSGVTQPLMFILFGLSILFSSF